jgi:hypothetical protein
MGAKNRDEGPLLDVMFVHEPPTNFQVSLTKV